MIIRSATPDDASAILTIYAYYVESTAISFEYDVPSVEEFRERITNTLKRYPYFLLVSRRISFTRSFSSDSKLYISPIQNLTFLRLKIEYFSDLG